MWIDDTKLKRVDSKSTKIQLFFDCTDAIWMGGLTILSVMPRKTFETTKSNARESTHRPSDLEPKVLSITPRIPSRRLKTI
jgi:hypothetical protein